ncbi:methyl-accepting chemotaxis protein McpA [Clostridium aceticum]|uniref:Methyl-accepting chemotaxis protein McpA n=1 Tax=Clostridium aceticum TaxID=84022 RepID=A0A0G3WGK0_9CLOT|nr:methyl-accepting chemotaxis protein [Clostridium aceticum]AKL97000.1 methyl-accepting chemotaxis protein McpA [Clostridium aceticum]
MNKFKSTKHIYSVKVKLIAIPLIIVFAAILGIGGISSYLTRSSMLDQMRQNGLERTAEIANQIAKSTTSVTVIDEMIEDRIRAIGRNVITHQDNLSNEFLMQIAKDLDADEINVYNENGEIIFSNLAEENVGWIAPETHFAQLLLRENKGELMEEIRESTIDSNYYKYGYLKSERGQVVQVGIIANRIQELSGRLSHQNLVEELAKEDSIVYALFIDKNLKAVAHSNRDRIGVELTDEGSKIAAVDGREYTSEFDYDIEKVRVYDVLMPVMLDGEHIGAINIGLSMDRIHGAIQKNFFMIAVIGIVFFLILGFVLFMVCNNIVKTLNVTKEHLNLTASGDFTFEVSEKHLSKKDELGEIANAIKNMQRSIKGMIQSIANTSQQVASSSEELTATSQQSAVAADEVAKTIETIARGANDQAKDTGNGVKYIQELGKLIETDQLHIHDLNLSANEVTKLKDEGFEILKDLVEKTNINNGSIQEVQEIIVNTNESAEKIESASQMIKNIAEQTNLLALNAAIEAARAGEAGRGFAVVAEEIRKLAEQSNTFTEEIATIIKELTDKTGHAVGTMQEVGRTVASQTASVESTNTKFRGIDSAIEKMKQIILEINQSGRAMEGKKEEIIAVIQNLSTISQENAAGTEEASASVQEQTASMEEIANASYTLAQLAEEMQESIARFKC